MSLEIGRVQQLIERVATHLGCDYAGGVVFPEERKDVAAVKYSSENGSDYGFDTIFLVWESQGKMQYREIADSRNTKDYLHIHGVTVKGEMVTVVVSTGGGFSGRPWEKKIKVRIG